MTYHAAYEPQRAVRTERWKYIRRFDDFPGPVLANCDDSASKEIWVAAGWADRRVPRELLYDLVLDPAEMNNCAADPACAEALAEMRGRLADVDAGHRRPAAGRPGRAAAGRPGQRAVAGLARRADPHDHGRSHGRSIQVMQFQPEIGGAPPGSRDLAVLEGRERAVGGAQVPHPRPQVLGEGGAEIESRRKKRVRMPWVTSSGRPSSGSCSRRAFSCRTRSNPSAHSSPRWNS